MLFWKKMSLLFVRFLLYFLGWGVSPLSRLFLFWCIFNSAACHRKKISLDLQTSLWRWHLIIMTAHWVHIAFYFLRILSSHKIFLTNYLSCCSNQWFRERPWRGRAAAWWRRHAARAAAAETHQSGLWEPRGKTSFSEFITLEKFV